MYKNRFYQSAFLIIGFETVLKLMWKVKTEVKSVYSEISTRFERNLQFEFDICRCDFIKDFLKILY